MSEPTLDQRTPIVRLKYEADDARNYNWSKIDDTIGRAFTPGSPLQLPGGVPPVGLPASTVIPQVWCDQTTHALANVSNGPLLDALGLVLADGHIYRVTLAGDIAKVAGAASIIALIGGVLFPGYTVGGGTGAQQETFLIEFTVRIEGTLMKMAGVMRSAVGTNAMLPATTQIVSESLAKAGSGNGIYIQATWDNVAAGNTAHTTIGMIECI